MPPFWIWASVVGLLSLNKLLSQQTPEESIRRRSRPNWEKQVDDQIRHKPRPPLYHGLPLWRNWVTASAFFAGQLHRRKDFTHLLVLGTTGTGKSQLCLQPFLKTWLRHTKPRETVVLVDTKGDFTEILTALGKPFFLLDLMDLDAWAWDMGADFADLSRLKLFGQYLFPDKGGDNQFFVNAARDIFLAVLTLLIDTHGERFQLSDLYNAILADRTTLLRLLRSHPEGQRVAHAYLEGEAQETADSILSELASVKGKLDIPCAHWQRSTQRFSLRRFLREGGTLVVRFDVDAKETTFSLGKFLISSYIDFINAGADTRRFRHLLLLDEAHFVGKVLNLIEGVNFSRSKGLSILIASQSITGLHHVYGREQAQAILNSCAFQMFLRAEEQTNALLQAEQFGKREVTHWVETENFGQQPPSYGFNQDQQVRPVVTDRDFLTLPTPSPSKGFSYYARTPFGQTIRGHLSFRNPFLKGLLLPTRKPRPRRLLQGSDQLVRPWTEADLERLFPPADTGTQWSRAAQTLGDHLEQTLVQLYEEALELLHGAIVQLLVARNPTLGQRLQQGRMSWLELLTSLAQTLSLRRTLRWGVRLVVLSLTHRVRQIPRRVAWLVLEVWRSLIWTLEHWSVQAEKGILRLLRRFGLFRRP